MTESMPAGPLPHDDLTPGVLAGKTALVTGATGGIGLETAAALGRLGAEVLLVGRSAGKLAAAAERTGAARTYRADLSVLSEVRRVSGEVRRDTPRLDILVNNAGGIFEPRQETAEGLEMTWALNHLAPFLLTRELRPALRCSADPRVVTVASDAHRLVRHLDLDDPEGRRGYSAWGAYNASKLANVLFARELARREPWLRSNALHPGVVDSGFNANNRGLQARLWPLVQAVAVSPAEGAATSVYLAAAPDLRVSGGYWERRAPARPSPLALDDALALRLWTLSEEYLRRLEVSA